MLPIPAFPDLWTIAAIVIVIGLLAAMAGGDPGLHRQHSAAQARLR